MGRKILIDADIVIHHVTHACERHLHWGDDIWTTWGDVREAWGMFKALSAETAEVLGSTLESCVFVFTDYTRENWRRRVMPTYKAHRPGVHRKPVTYWPLRERIENSKLKSHCFPTLEADDGLGYLQGISPDDAIIVSEDKDLKQIPGYLYNPNQPQEGLRLTTEAEGDFFHLFQTLTGDAVDGYFGCPGIGPVRARRALEASPTWDTVRSLYLDAGLTEDDALCQARVARILRTPEYDPKTGKVLLWTPPDS